MHRLIVPDPHADDRAGNPRGDADDIGADLAISRPGILQVAVVEGDGRPNRQAQQGNRDEGFEQLRLHGKKSAPMSELNRTSSATKNKGRCHRWRDKPVRSRIAITSHAARKPMAPMNIIQGTSRPATLSSGCPQWIQRSIFPTASSVASSAFGKAAAIEQGMKTRSSRSRCGFKLRATATSSESCTASRSRTARGAVL